MRKSESLFHYSDALLFDTPNQPNNRKPSSTPSSSPSTRRSASPSADPGLGPSTAPSTAPALFLLMRRASPTAWVLFRHQPPRPVLFRQRRLALRPAAFPAPSRVCRQRSRARRHLVKHLDHPTVLVQCSPEICPECYSHLSAKSVSYCYTDRISEQQSELIARGCTD
jgi:hypothetical protein